MHPKGFLQRLLVGIALGFGLLGLAGTSLARTPFLRDVEGDPAEAAIRFLVQRGVFIGYSDGTFRPNRPLTRAEMAKIIVASTRQAILDPNDYENCFPDVRNEWFAPFVCYAKENEWLHGHPDGWFRPGDYATKAEMLKVVLRTYDIDFTYFYDTAPFWDVRDGNWFNAYVRAAEHEDLLAWKGGSFLDPNGFMPRRQAAQLLYAILLERQEALKGVDISF